VPAYLQRLTQETPLQGRRFASMVISQPTRSPANEGAEAGRPATPRGAPAYVDFEISSEPSARSAPPSEVKPQASK
jgi:hypothetical protein